MLDMSLDDLAKERRNRGGRGGGPRRGGGGRGRGGGQGGPMRRERNTRFRSNSVPYANRRPQVERVPSEGGADNDRWKHDMFDKNRSEFSRRNPKNISFSGGDRGGTVVRISNLHYEASEEDLAEIFKEIGEVKNIEVKYDKSGRSTGEGEVVFARAKDAEEAVKQYDGARVERQPMTLEIVESNFNTRGPRNNNNNNNNNNDRQRGSERRVFLSRGRGGRRGGRDGSSGNRSVSDGTDLKIRVSF